MPIAATIGGSTIVNGSARHAIASSVGLALAGASGRPSHVASSITMAATIVFEAKVGCRAAHAIAVVTSIASTSALSGSGVRAFGEL